MKTTNLTDAFDYETFMSLYRDAIPLFLIGEDGELTIFAVKDPPQPGPGHRLVAIVNPLDEPGRANSDHRSLSRSLTRGDTGT